MGSRIIAALIDLGAQLIALLILVIVDGSLNADADLLAALVIVELILVLAGYPVLFEWLGHGRTLGKLAMGLRVVRDDGGPIGFRQALVRGLTGLVLEKPGLFAPVGTAASMIALGASDSSKRFGDMMAGTFVLNERVGSRSAALAAPPLLIPYGLEHWAAAVDLTRLDDRLALAVRQFVVRASQLTPGARQALGEDLCRRVMATVLVTVLAERRRRASMPAMGYPAIWPPPPFPGPQFPGPGQPQFGPWPGSNPVQRPNQQNPFTAPH